MKKEILKNIIDKVDSQRINTLYDDFILKILNNFFDEELSKNEIDNIIKKAHELLCINKKRFFSWDDRKRYLTDLDLNTYHLSQGARSVLKWKEMYLYKSCYDLAIYTQLIDQIKPGLIIEYGSGDGGSAVWMEDMVRSLNLDTKIISYDINPINIKDTKVIFNTIDLEKELPEIKKQDCKKIVIEDAHVNLVNLLLHTDKILNKDDYLIIEDSAQKLDLVDIFLNKSKNNYEIDSFYTDFFGKNCTTAMNTIFKVKG